MVNIIYQKLTGRFTLPFKIIKEPGTSFQSPALSQKHSRNVCFGIHQYVAEFHFDNQK